MISNDRELYEGLITFAKSSPFDLETLKRASETIVPIIKRFKIIFRILNIEFVYDTQMKRFRFWKI